MLEARTIFSFADWDLSHPGERPPGDRIDAQFAEIMRGLRDLSDRLGLILRDDGVVRNHAVGRDSLAPDLIDGVVMGLRAEIAADIVSASGSSRAAEAASAAAWASARDAGLDAARAVQALESVALMRRQALDDFAGLVRLVEDKRAAIQELGAPKAEPAPIIGYGAGGFYGADPAGAAATAADWAQVSIEWAEHMPDTIPPNVLAAAAVTGDHWSSRWWANRAANAFGVLAAWYQGAWASPGPPTTPYDATGLLLKPGAMYWDLTRSQMLVWTGSAWVVPLGAPTPAFVSSLFYLAAAGQTVFPTTAADINGLTHALAADEGVAVALNGVRLAPTADFTFNTTASTITLARPAYLNAVLGVDVLIPAAKLAPGAVLVKRITPVAPDGTATSFALATVDGYAVNVLQPQELFVSVDGVPQEPVVQYSASGATITFVEPPRADSKVYITWSVSATVAGGSGGGVAEAPNDATIYARGQNGWRSGGVFSGNLQVNGAAHVVGTVALDGAATFGDVVVLHADPVSPLQAATKAYVDANIGSGGGGGISEAPNDGTLYGRKSLGWTAVPVPPAAPVPSSATPLMDGTGSAGATAAYARGDHIHPSDASKLGDAPSDGSAYGRLSAAWAKVLPLAGGVLTGALSVVGGIVSLSRVQFAVPATVTANGATAIDFSLGEIQRLSLTGNATLSVSNWPAAGNFARLLLDISNTGAFNVTAWPSNIRWANGNVPVITSGAGKRDVVILTTLDAGATVLGAIVGQNFA